MKELLPILLTEHAVACYIACLRKRIKEMEKKFGRKNEFAMSVSSVIEFLLVSFFVFYILG